MSLPPACNGCGFPLLLKNLYVDDGCPCNTPRGVNFTPQPCEACRTDNCVKPGHRLVALYGPYGATGAPDPALSKGVRLSLSSEKQGIPEKAGRKGTIDTAHPEGTCERCGGGNVVWFAPSPIWNAVVRPNGEQGDLMLCPVCFIVAAEAAGFNPPAWKVEPEPRAQA